MKRWSSTRLIDSPIILPMDSSLYFQDCEAAH
jgi:hypothetical protein